MQRRLINDGAAQNRFVLIGMHDRQAIEPTGPVLVALPLHPNLNPLHVPHPGVPLLELEAPHSDQEEHDAHAGQHADLRQDIGETGALSE